MDYAKILADIARAIVDTPESVSVTESTEGNSIELTLSVAPDDMGKVIGRHGKIAKAIRAIMKAAGGSCGKRVIVEIE